MCILAALMDFYSPTFYYNAFVPSSIATWNSDNDFMLQQLGGALLMLAFIDIVLLRYTDDIKTWKILEAAVLIYDASLLYSSYYSLSQQGRLGVGALRWEDWGGILITAQAVVVRTAFLLDVGLTKLTKEAKSS